MERQIAAEGAILAVCEKDQVKTLRNGFVYACHAIVERIDDNTWKVVKHRSDQSSTISQEDLEKSVHLYTTVIFVIDKETIINQRVSDMVYSNSEAPIKDFYHRRRGTIIGKKFGL